MVGGAAWAAQEGLAVGRLLTEVGSALNGTRPRFPALLRDPTVTTIVVEPRDRLARFGAEEVEAALAAQGGGLVGIDPAEVDEDLVRDVSELLSGRGARHDGRRPLILPQDPVANPPCRDGRLTRPEAAGGGHGMDTLLPHPLLQVHGS